MTRAEAVERWRRARQRALANDAAGRHIGLEVVPVMPEYIPEALRLERRPTRDEREEELAQLRTADGRILALVERVDPASLPN